MKKFIIVDGNSLANRAYYAMPYLSNSKGLPSGAVYGFANLITKLLSEQKPDYFAVAFDHARKTFRNEIYADYKGTRKETPQDLRDQFPVIKNLLYVMGIKVFEFAGIEADDIIGTISKNSDVDNILVSGDRDLLQLVSKNTQVWLTRKGVTDIEIFDENNFVSKWGFEPSGIIELKALMGDSSDNIPGVPGVGEKTAMTLLSDFGSVDGVYQNLDKLKGKLLEKLENGKDSAYMSKKLATIKTDCEIDFLLDDCKVSFPYSQDVRDFFRDWDFRSLVSRNDIFSNVEDVKVKKIERKEFKSIEDILTFKNKIKNVFCYDFKNLEFACNSDEIYSLSKEYSLFGENIEFSKVAQILKGIFEDENILKITYSSKVDKKILSEYGVALKNFFDLDIANYVLYAGLPKKEQVDVCDYFETKTLLEKEMIDKNVFMIYKDIEIPLVDVLFSMEKEGFRVDPNELQLLDEKYNAMLEETRQKIYKLAGEEFNINSPKQVAEILFDKLGLKAFNNKKRSTNVDILEELAFQHEIAEHLIVYRKISKLVSTYINVYQNICKTNGNVVHTIFNQTLTATGRLSSSEPNMQNIPTRNEEGKNLRKIFVSKYENGSIVSADYSQIELRLLANMANEESMIDAYNHGVDIHTKTASEIFGVPVDMVNEQERRDAKAVNFGIIYGISDFGLSQNIKTSVAKAKHYIENYFIKYPKIKTFMDGNIAFAKENGFIKSYFGRIRHIPEIKSSNRVTEKFGERVAMNMPLQGTASDVIKLAMIKVFEKLKGMKSHMILQVHDELIVDCPKDELEKVKQILKSCMESVCNFVVPLTVSVSSGKNLFECK